VKGYLQHGYILFLSHGYTPLRKCLTACLTSKEQSKAKLGRSSAGQEEGGVCRQGSSHPSSFAVDSTHKNDQSATGTGSWASICQRVSGWPDMCWMCLKARKPRILKPRTEYTQHSDTHISSSERVPLRHKRPLHLGAVLECACPLLPARASDYI